MVTVPILVTMQSAKGQTARLYERQEWNVRKVELLSPDITEKDDTSEGRPYHHRDSKLHPLD